ncbi:hypothetical protein [Enterococcus termitis]|uniref:Uncharacterized protein n=1 Tax=Enterococcus termitis TaxID=332950 RepID=A0A1E5H0N2_9ENTE|nr:hypothetical protein [Enterococcus termitis]OEG18190.1 hypothetical protein BCR25_17015 [Enterococcus termitis]
MTTLDWIFASMSVLAILTGLFFVLFLFLTLGTRRKLKSISTKRPKNKKKRKKIYFMRKRLLAKKKNQRNTMLLFLLCSVLFAGAGAYAVYYQSTNLTTEDSDSIVQGYYLLQDFDSELEKAGKGSESQTKTDGNLRYLSNAMSSFGSKKASTVNTEEGQLTLNRYYNSMKELGTNATNNYTRFYNNPALVEEYRKDIKKVQQYEKKVIELYKVNESALKNKK